MWSWCKCPELPVARKCCFCVPVRRAVIIFGYVNLTVWLLMFPMLVFMLAERATRGGKGEEPGGGEGGATGRLQLPLTTACVLLDAVMTVVLLVGAHQKRRSLLAVYLWGGGAVQLVVLALDLVFFDARHPLLNAVFLLFLGLNMYLLYLVWSVCARLRALQSPPPPPQRTPLAPAHRNREWRYVMHPHPHSHPHPHTNPQSSPTKHNNSAQQP